MNKCYNILYDQNLTITIIMLQTFYFHNYIIIFMMFPVDRCNGIFVELTPL